MEPKDPVVSPDVAAAPSAPIDSPPAAATTPGETPVTTPETEPKQTVPFDRFQEVNSKAAEYKAQLDAIEAAKTPAVQEEEESGFDPEADKLLTAWAKRQGFVKQTDLEADKRATAFERDMADLASTHKGFSPDKVAAYAKENLGGDSFLTTKSSYQLVWDKMNEGDRIEAARKAALAEAADPKAFAERPGQGSPKAPAEAAPSRSTSPVDRIRAARERISGS